MVFTAIPLDLDGEPDYTFQFTYPSSGKELKISFILDLYQVNHRIVNDFLQGKIDHFSVHRYYFDQDSIQLDGGGSGSLTVSVAPEDIRALAQFLLSLPEK